MNKTDTTVLKSAGIEISPIRADERSEEPSAGSGTEKPLESRDDILKKVEDPGKTVHPILEQSMFGSVQTPIEKTEHVLENLSTANKETSTSQKSKIPKVDPYREIPE